MNEKRMRHWFWGAKRLHVVLSAWIAVVLGLPVWYRTTVLQRASLPRAQIESLTRRLNTTAIHRRHRFLFHVHLYTQSCALGSLGEDSETVLLTRVASALGATARDRSVKAAGLLDAYVEHGACLSTSNMLHASFCGTEVGASCDEHMSRLCEVLYEDEEAFRASEAQLAEFFNTVNDDGLDQLLTAWTQDRWSRSGERFGDMYLIVIDTCAFAQSQPQQSSRKFHVGPILGGNRAAWQRHAHTPERNESAVENISRNVNEAMRVMMTAGASGTLPHTFALSAADKDGASATLSMFLLNPQPQEWWFSWDFDKLSDHYLAPLARRLSGLGDLRVEGQIRYHVATEGNVVTWSEAYESFIVNDSDLHSFIEIGNSNLVCGPTLGVTFTYSTQRNFDVMCFPAHIRLQDTSSSTPGRSPAIHFAIFVPPVSMCPLRIRHVDGSNNRSRRGAGAHLSVTNSYFMTSWGVVFIYNPPGCSAKLVSPNETSMAQPHHELSTEALQEFMAVSIAHLRALLGLPAVPATSESVSLRTLPSRGGFSQWEVDLLVRRRTIVDIEEAASTLSALVALANSLPGMMIEQEIVNEVNTALEAIDMVLTQNSTNSYPVNLATLRTAAQRVRQASEEVG
eukprot:scaffold140_cov565-Prasinococcus_capsulatus_cf.AAC.1